VAVTRRYAEDLRSVGQALEAGGIRDFELKRVKDLYVIQGITPEPGRLLSSKLDSWLGRLLGRSTDEPIIFHPADVAKLSQAGRAKRSKLGQLTDFHTVSNILRTIGAYLDAGELELVELQKRRISVTLCYRDKAGQIHKEVRSISSFYRFFLDLCGRRGQPL
jgi:hypothetical protein